VTPRIGLALGSGSARGWAHIGVLEALEQLGVRPDVVAGSSIGALVGAAYCGGELAELKSWVLGLGRLEVVRMLDWSMTGGGLLHGRRALNLFNERLASQKLETLVPRFAAVATDLSTGREIWLTKGPILDAVQASIALPGLFKPVRAEGRWLVDGGLVNPVPVSVCRALGADVVIAVNLNGDILTRRQRLAAADPAAPAELSATPSEPGSPRWHPRNWISFFQGDSGVNPNAPPGLFDVTTTAINIMQDRITRSRMAGDPPDWQIAPRLGQIGLMEFYRAAEAISEGRAAVERGRGELTRLLGL
jgi:NTE family protein